MAPRSMPQVRGRRRPPGSPLNLFDRRRDPCPLENLRDAPVLLLAERARLFDPHQITDLACVRFIVCLHPLCPADHPLVGRIRLPGLHTPAYLFLLLVPGTAPKMCRRMCLAHLLFFSSFPPL